MKYCQIILCLLCMTLFGCKPANKKNKDDRPYTFLNVKGIKFYEVRRTFNNGLAFSKTGFQQEPEWIIQFKTNDTVEAYNPGDNKMHNFYLYYDHGAVYNFANEWFRVKKVNKDSLIFQRLQVNNKVVLKDIRSNVFMTFYAENYIKNTLHTSVKKLQEPRKIDTLFVKKCVQKANTNIFDTTSFFAARNPVIFKAKNKQITTEKIIANPNLLSNSKSYAYLYPEYKIVINKAYKDFSYYIKVIVDKNGKVFIYDFAATDDYRLNRKKVLQGIIDIYFYNLLKIIPGNTLGLNHSSVIAIDLVGRK